MNDQFLQGVLFDWNRIDNDSYLKRIKAFKGIEKLVFNKPITFFVGENGSGKSTLLEALAVAHGFNPEGGTKNYVFSTHDTHSELCDAIRISKGYRKEKWGYFLRAESFYNVATKEEEYADLTHPSAKYHEKSHGESFLALAQNNLRPNGLYLFDEPEAALSPQRQLTLLMQIYSCAKEGAQFIIVTHSPILLGMEETLPASAKENVEALYKQSEKLRFLIDSLVKLSRLENGIISLSPQQASLQPLLESVVEQYAAKASGKGLSIYLYDTDISATFDFKWTAEALANIVDNAIKYTEHGTITISTVNYEMFTRIDISDTGSGIPENEQAKIFSRFYRSNAVQEQEGVGIGLYLARQIISGESGYIKVASVPGKGSAFSIFLPK